MISGQNLPCVLGIETSCDETGLAIYDGISGLKAHVVRTQAVHQDWGGVVPELASRDHVPWLPILLQEVLHNAHMQLSDLEVIAYTQGPGLVGALMVGAAFARTLGYALSVPVLGINHLEAHLMAVFLEKKHPDFPFLGLLVSGGHTILVHVQAFGSYRILGESVDDALGEAFDKVGKILGLGYPGGPALEQLAKKGSPNLRFPKPMQHSGDLNFSFSGLKTHIARLLVAHPSISHADVAYAFEEAVCSVICSKCLQAIKETGCERLVVAGGVASNQNVRRCLEQQTHVKIFYPNSMFCTDNGAMIAITGALRFQAGARGMDLNIPVRARWSLEEISAVE